jgi:prepilin-type N-terminal cleavage/methylation domain-containing protein
MRARCGFTLVEVIMALMLLSVSMLGMQMIGVTMLRRTTTSQVRLSATQLAEDRVDVIKLEPVYANVDSYAATETALPGFPGYTRTTSVNGRRDSTATGIIDYKRVTVSVTATGLTMPVSRNITIAAP